MKLAVKKKNIPETKARKEELYQPKIALDTDQEFQFSNERIHETAFLLKRA